MYNMMICDDEITLRNGLKKLIERSGLPFTVCALAKSGPEALSLIREQHPAVVLMDINMPGISGLDVIEETRALEIPVKFIIISGHDEFQYAQKACRLEVADYLLKPIRKEELLSILEKIIIKLKQEEEIRQLTESKSMLSSHTADSSVPTPSTQGERILSYVQNHFTENSLSLAQLADEFHLSQSYVTRLIKQQSGKSFSELLNQYRIEHAMSLLISQKDLKLWAVAEECGFTSQHYFSRVFKHMTGCTPAEYRSRESSRA